MSDKPVTWGQGIAVVGGCFGLCCMGFMLLHGMLINDKAFASKALADEVAERNRQIDRVVDSFERFRSDNENQHRQIIMLLGGKMPNGK